MLIRDPGFRRPLRVCFLLALVVLIEGAGFQAPPLFTLAGYWPGDDGGPSPAPSAAADASGNGNSGSYINNATTSTSVPTLGFPDPTSMSFDGVSATVDVPTFSWPTGGPVTVSYWSFVAAADVKQSSSFSVGNMDSPNRFQCHGPWSDGFIYWDYGTYTAGGRVSADYSSHYGAWTHVALTSQGAVGTGQAIYLDGVQAVSASTSVGPTVPLTGLSIGGWPGASLYVKGQIDDFRIYDRVLTDPEIAALAAGDFGPAPATALSAVPGNFQVTLNWTDSTGPGPLTYTVARASISGGSPPGTYATVATQVSGTTYVDTTAVNGNTYYYVVFADSFGESLPSNQATVTPNASVTASSQGKGEANCHASASPSPGLAPVLVGLGVLGFLVVRRR